ncbi:MAG: xanthine dehydrogenase family protein subunit M [bacterium]
MRSYVPDFPVVNPNSLDDALDVMYSEDDVTPLAGGTDIMVYMESGDFPETTLLNLYALNDVVREPELNGELELGPLSTYSHTRQIEKVANTYPMLATAAREISVLALQSRATWIGNIVNASPAADGVPALMAYDATVECTSQDGTREIPLHNFYNGYKDMEIRDDELITAVKMPIPDDDWEEYYRKVGTRRFQAISKTLLSGRIKLDDAREIVDVRLVFASVAPYTLRATETEELLRGRTLSPDLIDEATDAIQDEINPIDDIRSNETYRRKVTSNLIQDFLSDYL